MNVLQTVYLLNKNEHFNLIRIKNILYKGCLMFNIQCNHQMGGNLNFLSFDRNIYPPIFAFISAV